MIKVKQITLYQSEALSTLKELAKQGIIFDAVITDVPFGTTKCAWDSVIPLAPMWEALTKCAWDRQRFCDQ